MKLILFDIDGTLLDSIKIDDFCFKSTFKKLHHIDLSNAEWNDFKHVTDLGLTKEIFEKYLNKQPSYSEIDAIKSEFIKQISSKTKEITQIKGAFEFLELVDSHNDLTIAIATGGWKETAVLKCKAIGIDLDMYVVGSSNDHYDRSRIIQISMDKALKEYRQNFFDSVVYFGDGIWDFEATGKLGINFIGVDSKNDGTLKNAGCKTVIRDFSNPVNILNLIQ